MYLEYAENKEKPFILNILMEKAEEDLFDILQRDNLGRWAWNNSFQSSEIVFWG